MSDISRGDNIYCLSQFRRPMTDPILNMVLGYWERLRAGRAAPLRSEIDPRQIEAALEHSFILERVAPDTVRFRVAGMHLCQIMGMEVRGMPPSAFFTPEERGEFARVLDGVFTRPEVAELDLISEGPGLVRLEARMLILPMRSDLGEMNRALGCLVAQGTIGAPPRRFRIGAVKSTRIAAADQPARAERAPGFAEPRAAFEAPPARPRPDATPRPNLRLVRNEE
jgi:hypothetical protein